MLVYTVHCSFVAHNACIEQFSGRGCGGSPYRLCVKRFMEWTFTGCTEMCMMDRCVQMFLDNFVRGPMPSLLLCSLGYTHVLQGYVTVTVLWPVILWFCPQSRARLAYRSLQFGQAVLCAVLTISLSLCP